MGATFYVEPLLTFDLDIFVLLPGTAGGLLTLAPLDHDYLNAVLVRHGLETQWKQWKP